MKHKKDVVIDDLIADDIRNGNDSVEDMLRYGVFGYVNMSNEDLANAANGRKLYGEVTISIE